MIPKPTTHTLDHAVWHRSSYSGTHGNCVEVALNLAGVVGVRDSKDRDGAALIIDRDEWQRFVRSVRGGRLGL